MTATIEPAHDLGPEQIDALEDRLYEHNSSATGYFDAAKLGFVARREDGTLSGGIAGYTWGGVLEIGQLWVAESDRGRGLGLALIDEALAEARRRGCTYAFVLSFDFQAPAFYERVGFSPVATIEDWPLGHQHVILRKSLA